MKIHVHFNQNGQPVSDGAVKLVTHIGVESTSFDIKVFRWDVWKQGHLRNDGSFTDEATKQMAKKIDDYASKVKFGELATYCSFLHFQHFFISHFPLLRHTDLHLLPQISHNLPSLICRTSILTLLSAAHLLSFILVSQISLSSYSPFHPYLVRCRVLAAAPLRASASFLLQFLSQSLTPFCLLSLGLSRSRSCCLLFMTSTASRYVNLQILIQMPSRMKWNNLIRLIWFYPRLQWIS
ncbi:uncharacterized protein LOC111306530 [Durio zibethinus]|uniref:Uncharacterized protein LOC111306530 n=1 Tax=Durio zibethinus TaxID=66656 RepID=A0A6P6A546_DURZI|nr:uncharacterized protein LOC111306530 [Durio zibethinus]